ncbi:MAG: Coq4 family protein [Myxococcota bacterium]
MLTPRQWARLGLSIVRGMRDSTRTDELIVAEELVCRGRFAELRRELEARIAASPEAQALMRQKPRLATDALDYAALRRLPVGTVGRAYVDFLDRHRLDPNALAEPAGKASGAGYADRDAGYLHERYRQCHDVWHALTGLGIEGYEEVVLHAFTWGQLRLPYSALIVAFGTLKHVLLERRWDVLRHGLADAWRAGLAAQPLILVHWEERWGEPLERVRAELGIRVLGRDDQASAAAA